MLSKSISCTLSLGFLGIIGHPYEVSAQKDPVTVSKVKFKKDNLQGILDDKWAEVAITIVGGANSDEGARAFRRNFIDQITVILTLSYQVRSGRRQLVRVFQAEATIPTLKQGQNRTLYFYLPPEVIKRDRLPLQPWAYLVELEVGGQALPTRREHLSSTLKTPSQVAQFKSRAVALSKENEGVLLPIYATPFYSHPDKLKDSPAYVRKAVP